MLTSSWKNVPFSKDFCSAKLYSFFFSGKYKIFLIEYKVHFVLEHEFEKSKLECNL
jgi:hypothetical protein